MVGPRFTGGWPDNYVTATIATFVAGRIVSGDGRARSERYDPSVGWQGIGHAVMTRARCGTESDEYEVTATLKVRGADLEEVVARTFADPYCVDVRVQSTRWLAYPSDEGDA